MDCRDLGSVSRHAKPPGSAAIGQVQCTGYVICDRLGRLTVANVALNPRYLWTPLLWGPASITRISTMCTFALNRQWQHHSSTGEAVYGDPQSTGMSFLGLTKKKLASEKHLQFELLACRNVSNIDTETNADTYSTIRAAATTSNDQQFHYVCRAEVKIATVKCLYSRYLDWQTLSYIHTTSPLYNRLWAVLFQMEMNIFWFVWQAEVNIAIEQGLQCGSWPQKSCLGPRHCVWKSKTLWLSVVALSIQMFNAIPIML
jgi:hypothetical protein